MLCVLNDNVVWDRLTSVNEDRVNVIFIDNEELAIVLDGGKIHENLQGVRFVRVFVIGRIMYTRAHKYTLVDPTRHIRSCV